MVIDCCGLRITWTTPASNVVAAMPGTCRVCTEPYDAGDDLGLVAEGWAHLDCYETVMEPPC